MAKKPATNARIIVVPLSNLYISPLNARANDTSDVSELAALLDSQGQLQNLIVVANADGNGAIDGHGVVGGGRRYRAFKLNEQSGKIPADHPVFCLLTDEDHALAASVAENSGRDEMHPADQFVAFKSLVETGSSIDDVAAKFGCTPIVVRRRLQLAKVSPKLVAAFRAGEMTLEALQAFTLVDSQKLQEKVWNNTPKGIRNAYNLRRALTEGTTDASNDRYAGFVGLDAYEAAGGSVIRDLFGGPDSGYIKDAPLMRKLAEDKLEAVAEQLRGEGWSFVTVYPEIGWHQTNPYGRSKPNVRALAPEEQAEINKLETACAEANERLHGDDDDELTDGDFQALEQMITQHQARIAAIRDAATSYTDRQKKKAGAVLGLDHNGSLEIHRGMVAPVDPKAAKAREKAKAAAAGEPVEDDRPAHSEALIRKLTANRSAALSAHLLEAPREALNLLFATLATKIFYEGYYGASGLAIAPTEQMGGLISAADDLEASKAFAVITDRREDIRKTLPEDPTALFRWAGEQTLQTIIELLAYCTAACINVTMSNEHTKPLEKVEQTIGLNMADWWQPTVKSYLGQVRKDVVTGALASVGVGDIAIRELDKLKKGDLGKKAEELLADSGWLPPILRPKDQPKPVKPKDVPAPAKKAAKGAKAPAAPSKTAAKPAATPTPPKLSPAAAWPFPTSVGP